jgi:clan AA aspartic protease
MAGPRVEVLRSRRMGLTQVPSRVKRPDGRGAAVRVRFLVDTGALYTVLPEHVWRTLRLKPTSTAEFGLADGTAIVRALSEARFEIAHRTATSPVVLGERDDAPLLGAVTLETLRLMVNPLTREVRPMGPLPMYRAFASAGP